MVYTLPLRCFGVFYDFDYLFDSKLSLAKGQGLGQRRHPQLLMFEIIKVIIYLIDILINYGNNVDI